MTEAEIQKLTHAQLMTKSTELQIQLHKDAQILKLLIREIENRARFDKK